MSILVLSCGVGPDLPPGHAALALEADVVAGGVRLLSQLPGFKGEAIPIAKDAAGAVRRLVDAAISGRRAVCLASGDALFHGVGRLILELAGDTVPVRFIAAPTAFQHLFARLGIPWDAARIFSVHSGNEPPCREILSVSMAVVYAGASITAAGVAARLIHFLPGCAGRPAVLAENLGIDGERIVRATIAELASLECGALSILLVMPYFNMSQAPGMALGLSDDFYSKDDGMITGAEARAVALSKLRLPPSGVLWDVGAGSGSVGLEAAALCHGLSVFAIEKNPRRADDISGNALRLGVANHSIRIGDAPAAMEGLPRPDRVFIGGGGHNLEVILDFCFDALPSGGILVASASMLESITSLANWNPDALADAATIDISNLRDVAGKFHQFKARNRITLFTFQKDVHL